MLMGLLTLAMELGAGLALQEGRKLNLSAHQQAEQARTALPAVECESLRTSPQLSGGAKTLSGFRRDGVVWSLPEGVFVSIRRHEKS